jgi:hypothetical protein
VSRSRCSRRRRSPLSGIRNVIQKRKIIKTEKINRTKIKYKSINTHKDKRTGRISHTPFHTPRITTHLPTNTTHMPVQISHTHSTYTENTKTLHTPHTSYLRLLLNPQPSFSSPSLSPSAPLRVSLHHGVSVLVALSV